MSTGTTSAALALADRWQRDFPLHPEPFARVAATCGLTQDKVIEFMQILQDTTVLARIGATVRPNTVGASTLAAMSVPPDRLDEVAAAISSLPAVNHNYLRDHEINLWFVVTAAGRNEVRKTLQAISRQSGIAVLDLPLERSYHIDLGFPLTGRRRKSVAPAPHATPVADETDRALLTALEDGLSLVRHPYAALAQRLDLPQHEVLARLGRLIETGIVTRFGCILRHRRIGFQANAMAVWDVPDERVDQLGECLARRDEVTLCYRRTRRLPAWPYNLFAMIHGRRRATVRRQIARAANDVGLTGCACAVLFSRRCFKQSVARLQPHMRGAA